MSGEFGSSRSDAKARGLKAFIPSTPCRHGSFAPRRVNGGCLCEACKRLSSERASAWQKNPANREDVLRNRERHAESGRRARRARYYRQTEREKAWARRWAIENPERARELRARWAERNPETVARLYQARKEAELRARPAWFTKEWDEFVMREALDLAKRRKRATGFAWERDHMVPLQCKDACGLHCAENIQVIPRALNNWKYNRLELTRPGEWIWMA